jgi:DNA-binding HxlR family transcriptional regulator
MLQRTYPDQTCSIARTLEVVGERWTMLVLRDALFGLRRFDEFRGSLGIASNVLAARLDRLCGEGLLERRPYQTRPERHEYLLTEKGRDLAPALLMLMRWGDRHYPDPAGPPRIAEHADCGGEIEQTLGCRRCGESVGFEAIALAPGPAHAPRGA